MRLFTSVVATHGPSVASPSRRHAGVRCLSFRSATACRHAVTPESVACPFVLPLLSATEPLCMDMHGHGDCQHGQIEIYWAPRPRMRTRICRLSPLPGLGGGCYAERLRNEEMVSCLTKLGECARSYSVPCSFSLLRYSEGHAHYAHTISGSHDGGMRDTTHAVYSPHMHGHTVSTCAWADLRVCMS